MANDLAKKIQNKWGSGDCRCVELCFAVARGFLFLALPTTWGKMWQRKTVLTLKNDIPGRHHGQVQFNDPENNDGKRVAAK
jgi:hypothetical protein